MFLRGASQVSVHESGEAAQRNHACGLWHPDPPAQALVRDAIIARDRAWQAIKAAIPQTFSFDGEQLARAPRGYDPTHPLIDDLRRKDFVVSTAFDESAACAPDFMDRFSSAYRTGAPYIHFLTEALGQPWNP